ncbi:MAG: insulinase family protein, partial [Lentisphaeria bacterium]|nr:insulinase family protein [Lentisphaeria bacterium]
MKLKKIAFFLILSFLFVLNGSEFAAKKARDGNSFEYEYVTNDPYKGRIYTLKNGLKVYLARIPVKPRIVVRFLVKAGLADSPADATGLAHYLEHLMFKGTDRIGSLDYEKEKVLLEKIEQLYEDRRREKDPEKKKAIFKEIDRLSVQASRYAAAGEYSMLAGALGGMGLNAFTSTDVTAYVVNIPSNELKRFLLLEAERLRNPVIRLFHTELEAVYQEFNHGQDSDARVLYET